MGLDAVPLDGAAAGSASTAVTPVTPSATSTTPVSGTGTSVPATPVVPATPAVPAASASTPAARPRRLWDSVLTALLLGIGIVSVTSSIPQYANFPSTLNLVLAQGGFGEYSAIELATTIGIALNVTQIVLYVVSAIVALLMIRRGKLGFFYPLIAGGIFVIVMIALMIVALTGDPELMASLTAGSGAGQ
jgi:hypothetical protein